MVIKSIRWRLQLWYGLILVLVLIAFGFTAYQVAYDHQLRRIDQELSQQLMAAMRPQPHAGPPGGKRDHDRGDFPPDLSPDQDHMGPPRGGERFEQRSRQILSRIRQNIEQTDSWETVQTNTFYFILWQKDGSMLASSSNAPPRVPCPPRPANARPSMDQGPDGPGMEPPKGFGFSLEEDALVRMRERFRELYVFGPLGECILAGRSILPEMAAMHRLALWLFAAGAGVLLLGLAGGWWVASRAIRPIDDISATALKIAAGDLSQRIDAADAESELGRLAEVLNSTFARLESAFAEQRRFTADASHELRTPLAVIITEAQTTLSRERAATEYRETLEGCLEAAQQMRRLIASLLELARFDAGQEPMARGRFDLSHVAQQAVELVRPLAKQRGVRIECDLPSVSCAGDAERISQVATNLITNAVQFNRADGTVRVATSRRERHALLEITDTGVGIAPEDLPHIFERFYRADKARSSGLGRTGLGLSICKAIVEAHSGTVAVRSEPGKGSTFTLKLPAD